MVDVLNVTKQFIHICYQKPGEMTKVYRTAVYASPNGTKQKKLWPQLAELVHDPGKAWLLGEDCNAIVSSDERGRGSINRSRVSNLFNNFILSMGLHDLGFLGPAYTWRRGSLKQSMINNKGEWDMDVLKTMLPSSSIAYITAVKQPMANDDFEDKPGWK
ncbi:hypothetical protein ERO13_D01G101250v2 [Gossypium hirsutum]|nr:hypothetical protein ERO13_D01G101250v2 [Gossypium hirsutum]